jgi:hypothetical protein
MSLEPRLSVAVDYTAQDHDNYAMLALAVIKSAIADLGRHEPDIDHAEALDFVLHRVNDPENIWGIMARSVGYRPLTLTRVQQLIRKPRRGRKPQATRPALRKELGL